jgi:hypothetical protein
MLLVEVVVDIVDKVFGDNMDEESIEDMAEKDMSMVWVASVEMNKAAVVDTWEIQLMKLLMVHSEVVEFEGVASYQDVNVLKEQNLERLDFEDKYLIQ